MLINEITGSKAFQYLRTVASKIRQSDEPRPYLFIDNNEKYLLYKHCGSNRV